MSNQRRLRRQRPTSDITQWMSQLEGQQIPGGCDDCNAYQTVRVNGPIAHVHVWHDDCCPFYNGVTR